MSIITLRSVPETVERFEFFRKKLLSGKEYGERGLQPAYPPPPKADPNMESGFATRLSNTGRFA